MPVASTRGRLPKYIFTPFMDAQIRAIYREGTTGKGEVRDLAKRLNLPRWRISRRARDLGVVETHIKEPEWCEKELDILKRSAHLCPERIQHNLKKAGFSRSTSGIFIKRKRMRFIQNLEGYSASAVAECFGLDVKAITRWIEYGYLKASRRGTLRTALQGGDMWYIKEKAIREFIIANVGQIDIRKVDKYWLVDILTKGEGASLANEREHQEEPNPARLRVEVRG